MIIRAHHALAAWCADHRIKLVHVWRVGDRWNAMAEWPYHPGKKVATERHATGVGDDSVAAVMAAFDNMGLGGLPLRLYVVGKLMEVRK